MMPAAPPTALGVNLGTSLNAAAIDPPAVTITREPAATATNASWATSRPPSLSAAIPPNTRRMLVASEKAAVSNPAWTMLILNRSVQKVGNHTVRAMNPPNVQKYRKVSTQVRQSAPALRMESMALPVGTNSSPQT